MELQATMALDRDAVNTVALRLLPPSTTSTSATCWLLLHTIPITASLSRTLSRLVSIEEAAVAQTPAPFSSTTATETTELLSPPIGFSVAAAGLERPTDVRSTNNSTTVNSRTSASRWMVGQHTTSALSSPTSSEPSSASSSANASFACTPVGWVEFVRVGYVVSEIHAYCILLKCRTPSQAVHMKVALEEGAALGVTAPVEFVSDEGLVNVTRRIFAETPEQQEQQQEHQEGQVQGEVSPNNLMVNEAAAEAVAASSSRAVYSGSQRDESESNKETASGGVSLVGELPSTAAEAAAQGPRWRTEVHAMILFDAATTIYPIRDGEAEEEANHNDDSCDATDKHHNSSGNESRHFLTTHRSGSNAHYLPLLHPHQQHQQSSLHRSQVHSPYPQQALLRRPHNDHSPSAPSSPSIYQRKSPVPPSSSTATAKRLTMTAATISAEAAAPSTSPVVGPIRARPAMFKGAAPPPPPSRYTNIAASASAATATSSTSPTLLHTNTNYHRFTPLHLPNPCTDTCGSPLGLDGTNVKNSTGSTNKRSYNGAQSRSNAAEILLNKTPGCLNDEFCAICQVDPLRSAACVTTLCQHSFHLHCYAQLPSGSAECPLCRFSVYDLLNDARCEVCGTYEDLWVCLICGHVACGRARRDHQQEHYRSSGHTCSWQSSTNRIWNLSSRMFLHQEVALLLDGTEASATTATTTEAAVAGATNGFDQLRCMSWAEPLDSDLQEALNESKEEAVAHYYTEFMRQLAEEQRQYYEARLAQQHSLRERRRWQQGMQQAEGREAEEKVKTDEHAEEKHTQEQQQKKNGQQVRDKETRSGGDGSGTTSLSPSSYLTFYSIVREERRKRRRVLAEYIPATVEILQQAQRECTNVYNNLKTTRDDVQQQLLLRSHFNSGLVAQIEQVRQRTHEAVRKGEKSMQAKSAEEVALQKKVEEALSAI